MFFPTLAVGVADLFTLAGGISLLPGTTNQIIDVAPKITPLTINKLSLATGTLLIRSTAEKSEHMGLLYGIGTYGTTDMSLTGGLGWGFSGSDIANQPDGLVGAMLRISDHTKLITENCFLPNSDISLLSLGIRIFGAHLAADLGLNYPLGHSPSGLPFFPWLGRAYTFHL